MTALANLSVPVDSTLAKPNPVGDSENRATNLTLASARPNITRLPENSLGPPIDPDFKVRNDPVPLPRH